MSKTPPREWVEKHFTNDGKVQFCQRCRRIPFVPMGRGHDCYQMGAIEAHMTGNLGEWVEEDADVARITLVENDDRPGDWGAFYEAGSSDA